MLLTDSPEDIRAALPALGAGDPVAGPVAGTDGPWSGFDRALWAALEVAGPPRILEASHDPFWERRYLLAAAEVSQFAALRTVVNARGGLPGHVACLALTGRNFQGQQGRSWQARRGNLHLSLGLKCALPAAEVGSALPMLPAVAVMDAVRSWLAGRGYRRGTAAAECGIKWVNDILCGSRKLGGVLTSIRTAEGVIDAVILGIGLNVAVAPAAEPTIFVPETTCLAELGAGPAPPLETVFEAVLAAVARRLEEMTTVGTGPLVEAYRADSLVVGRRVGIWPSSTGPLKPGTDLPEPDRLGTVASVGPSLELHLEGQPEPVTDGRLAFLS